MKPKGSAMPMRLLVLLITLFALLVTPSRVWSQESRPDAVDKQRAGGSSLALAAPDRKVAFDSTPFSPGSLVPDWDKGYVVSRIFGTTGPEEANVILYDSAGNKVREAAIWFPDAEEVHIVSAAVTSQGNIIASGSVHKTDGTGARFLARTDLAGKVTDVIQTGSFAPMKVCVTSNGEVWAFGDSREDGVRMEGDTLRRFDFQKGLAGSYLPSKTFPENRFGPAQAGNNGNEVYFGCQGNHIVIYSGRVSQYVEFDTTSNSAKYFKIEPPAEHAGVHGFALTEQGDVYSLLRDRSSSLASLVHLDIDEKAQSVRWMPVNGASSPGEPSVMELLGADGQHLVLRYKDDASTVSWSRVK